MAFSFGKPAPPAGGGLFGQNTTQNSGTSLFGQPAQQQQQPAQQSSGGLFGQPAQQQQSGGLFGQTAKPATGGLFGQSTAQTGGGLFGGGQQQQQQNTGGLFGQTQQQQPQQQSSGLFGQTQQQQPSSGLFGQTQQQPQQSMFGATAQPAQQQSQLQLGNSVFQPGQSQPVTAQMASILTQYLPSHPDCKFKYYFYNKVGSDRVPFYGPSSNEDPRAWDEALSKKPGPGYVPVLCTGFEQLGERIKAQQNTLVGCNRVMHQINGSLEAMMMKHDTGTSVRILNAKRKHAVLKQRTLKLATKVQILRNKGYAMDKAEEALKSKLEELERAVCDPQIPAKGEEIWARMVAVRARGRVLEKEMERSGAGSSGLDEEAARRAEKVLEDYATQLAHLKRELESIEREFGEWQKENGETKKR